LIKTCEVYYLWFFEELLELIGISRGVHLDLSNGNSITVCGDFLIPRFLFDGDQGTTSKDLIQVPIGPVTRARAKKFKDVLNGLIQELWAQANSWRPIEHDPQWQQRIVTLIQVLEG
jgi:hypothetical protein